MKYYPDILPQVLWDSPYLFTTFCSISLSCQRICEMKWYTSWINVALRAFSTLNPGLWIDPILSPSFSLTSLSVCSTRSYRKTRRRKMMTDVMYVGFISVHVKAVGDVSLIEILKSDRWTKTSPYHTSVIKGWISWGLYDLDIS